MSGDARNALMKFLVSAFTPNEFVRWLEGVDPLFAANLPAVENLPREAFFFEAANALFRRGLVNDAFFNELRKERARRTHEIEALRERIVHAEQSTKESSESSSPFRTASSSSHQTLLTGVAIGLLVGLLFGYGLWSLGS